MNKEIVQIALAHERYDNFFRDLCQRFNELSQDKEYFEKVSKSYRDQVKDKDNKIKELKLHLDDRDSELKHLRYELETLRDHFWSNG